MGSCCSTGARFVPVAARVSNTVLPEYAAVDPAGLIDELEAQLWRQAILTWVLVPAYVVISVLVPFTAPTCAGGFNDMALVGMVLLEAHHLYAESRAWRTVKSLLAPPEACVLRQLGVLRQRCLHVVLGILEALDNYTDWTFPFVARACGEILTTHWEKAWVKEPVVGHLLAAGLHTVRFWGLALLFAALNLCITGWSGLWVMQRDTLQRKRSIKLEDGNVWPRISGEVFIRWARSASIGIMPSVAMLCEAIADQRKWVFDGSKDAVEGTKARWALAMGKMSQDTAESLELQNFQEKAKVDEAAHDHYVRLLLAKVFLGNVMSLCLQGSFLALTWERNGYETKVKVLLSMAFTAVTALVRCVKVTSRIGWPGLAISLVIAALIGWTALQVYHAARCPDHVWDPSTGCVDLGRRH